MTLDPEAKAYLEASAALNLPPIAEQGAVEARRVARMRAPGLGGPPEPVAQVADASVPGPAGPVPVRVYRPAGELLGAVAFFHGGGWVTGDLDTHDTACRGIANRSRSLVVAVDFRNAPEHPYPAGLDDCFAATEWLGSHAGDLGGPSGPLAVCGDSAGGNLAAAVALRARERGGPSLAAQVLVYPVLDRDFDRPSYLAAATGYGLTRDSMRWYWEQYRVDELDPLPAEVAPLRAEDLRGLPPALVVTCEFDPLRDEGAEYARRLAAAGVPVVHLDEPGMIHGHLRMAGVMARTEKTWEDIGRFLRERFA